MKLRHWIPEGRIFLIYSSHNKKEVYLLEQSQDKVTWSLFSINKQGICIIENNPDEFNCVSLLRNSSALSLFEKNKDKVDLDELYGNNEIFELDYSKIEEHMNVIKEELMIRVFHPRNCDKFIGWGF